MAYYCTCNKCKKSPAQPARLTPGPVEQVTGNRVQMQPEWTLAHWSGVNFDQMLSTEIHNFIIKGNKPMVGCSFYLYKGQAAASKPRQLKLLGLGGNNRYTINSDIGHQLEMYYKGRETDNPVEVTVVVGCGGSIRFNQQKEAIGIETFDVPPVFVGKASKIKNLFSKFKRY